MLSGLLLAVIVKGHIIISETCQNIKQRAVAKKPIEKIKWSTKDDLINLKEKARSGAQQDK